MTTGFERNVNRRAGCPIAGRRERVHFGMRAAESFVPAFADDFAVANDHAADHRVRLNGSQAARGERERMSHVAFVVVGAACHSRIGFQPVMQRYLSD